MSDSLSPEGVVTANLAAYNARDLDGFVRWLDPAIEIHDLRAGRVLAQGLDDVAAVYRTLFDTSGGLHSEVVHRVVLDDLVVDHEHVTGRSGGDLEIVITYLVRGGRIQRIWMVRAPLDRAVGSAAAVPLA